MEDEAFLRLKAQFELFGLTRYYTDHWVRMRVTSTPDEHSPGKRHTLKHHPQ
jgi:hypothetical protein